MNIINQWFSTFLKLWLFNTAPHAVVTSNHKIIPMLLHAIVKNHNVENVISAFLTVLGYPCERALEYQKDCNPQVENQCFKPIVTPFHI